MKRSDALDALRTCRIFDCIVIGAGATGLGIAVDAAARGYSVVVLERDDVASGTSSRSTKLVHGGVRYLKQGNLALVRSALRERGRLARNAPHLVHDLPFVIPAYHPLDRSVYGLGLRIYEAMSGRLSLGPTRILSPAETRELLPTIEPAGLRGGVLYHDAQFDDARLAVTLARTAVRLGVRLATRIQITAIVHAEGRVAGVSARDQLTGESFDLRARVVVNATGVFVDELRALESPGARPLVTVSQGIHLVLPNRFLPGRAALMVPKTDDNRVLFVVPWHGRLIVGTTDTPRASACAEPRALEDECAFVLKHARRYLAVDPQPGDVLSVFAGLRPLVRRGAGRSTARLSRDHTVEIGPRGLITVTGGKWTTYRSMAAEVVDLASRLGRLPLKPSPTADLPLAGATTAAPPPGHSHLGVYGSDAARVLAAGAATPLHPRLPYLEAEVTWAAMEEMALTVEDVLARRTRALVLDAHAARAAAPRVAEILAEVLGRDSAWIREQVASFDALARGYCFDDPESRKG